MAETKNFKIESSREKFDLDDCIEALKKYSGSKRCLIEILSDDRADHISVASRLIDAGMSDIVLTSLNYFKELNEEVALMLLGTSSKFKMVERYLGEGQFGRLSKEFALKLLEKGFFILFVSSIEYFDGLDDDVAREVKDLDWLSDNLLLFRDVSEQVITKCYEERPYNLFLLMAKGSGINYNEFAHHFLEDDTRRAEYFENIRDHLEGENNISSSAAKFLVESEEFYLRSWYLDRVEKPDKELFLALKRDHLYVRGWDDFIGLDAECADKALEIIPQKFIANHDLFNVKLDSNIAFKLINAGNSREFLRYHEKFDGLEYLDCKALVDAIDIAKYFSATESRFDLRCVCEDLLNFANQFGKAKEVEVLFLQKLQDASILFLLRFFPAKDLSFSSVEEFINENVWAGLDDGLVADACLDQLDSHVKDREEDVYPYLEKIIEHKELAVSFLQKVVYYFGPYIEGELQDEGFLGLIKKAKKIAHVVNISIYDVPFLEEDEELGLHGRQDEDALEHDPFVDDPRFFSVEKIEYSIKIESIINRELTDPGEQLFGEFADNSNRLIDESLLNFKNELDDFEQMTELEKKMLFEHHAGSGVRPLRLVLVSLVARYLAQSTETGANLEQLSSNIDDLGILLSQGLSLFLQSYSIEIPLYDKLFEEFDQLRLVGRTPLEVYLGRDGIYAWLGRRSMDLARLRKLGVTGRKRQKEAGKILGIHPKYIEYPRYFRDNLKHELKHEFLEQERVTEDMDPLFYDTGYTGTIPEQMMRIMGFSQDEIEERIRLLSAPTPGRRVRGIDENARRSIVDFIEHNAKTTQSASGLLRDEETSLLRPVAMPTEPSEQFCFMLIKQALVRHYWIKIFLEDGDYLDTQHDAEFFEIKIQNRFKNFFQEDFLHDPAEFFNQIENQNVVLEKLGDQVTLELSKFDLMKTVPVLCKKTDSQNYSRLQEEYTFLLAAHKAGLSATAPIALVKPKKHSDPAFIVIEDYKGGTPGSVFREQLERTGAFTSVEIDSYLREVDKRKMDLENLYRETIDTNGKWYIQEISVHFDETTGKIKAVVPTSWSLSI